MLTLPSIFFGPPRGSCSSHVKPEEHFSFYAHKDSLQTPLAPSHFADKPAFEDLSPQSMVRLQNRMRFVGLETVPDAGRVGATYGAAAGVAVGLMLAPLTMGVSVAIAPLVVPVGGFIASHAWHLQTVHEVRPDQLDPGDFFATGVVESEAASRDLCILLQGYGILDAQRCVRRPQRIGEMLNILGPVDFELSAAQYNDLKTFFALFLDALRT